jgi:tetratricopeptide (TPR) repeat protein
MAQGRDQQTKLKVAMRQDQYHQALTLASQIYRADPTAENATLVFTNTVARVRQLLDAKRCRYALSVLNAFVPTSWMLDSQKDEILGLYGELGHLEAGLARFPDWPLSPAVFGLLVDAALANGAEGRQQLPPDLQSGFDVVRRAFVHLKAEQDEACREALASIGFTSPYLEWKLLIRGFLAYYAQDDVKALENWSRLSPKRLSFRLAAPLRQEIDPAFRASLDVQQQSRLFEQWRRLRHGPLQAALYELHDQLTKNVSLKSAFFAAKRLLPSLREIAPHLIPRLAKCMYSVIQTRGMPDDLDDYETVFGTPPDDPKFDRLIATILEGTEGGLLEANHHWKAFSESLKADRWPGEQLARAKAIIWLRMGNNVATEEDHIDGEFQIGRSRAFKPDSIRCFRNARDQDPRLLEAHIALFNRLLKLGFFDDAIRAGKALLEQFPDQSPIISVLADLQIEMGNMKEGWALLERAWHQNPLDQSIQNRMGDAKRRMGRAHAATGKFDEAAKAFRESLEFRDSGHHFHTRCAWAASEWKAGHAAEAEAILAGVANDPRAPALCARMVVECNHLKLPKSIKSRFDNELKSLFNDSPDPPRLIALLRILSEHRRFAETYHGLKSHETKAMALTRRIPVSGFSDEHLKTICQILLDYPKPKALFCVARLAQTRFPEDPYFSWFEIESHFDGDRLVGRMPDTILQQVTKLMARVAQMPKSDARDRLLASLTQREKQIRELMPDVSFLFRHLREIFDRPDNTFDEAEEEFEDTSW